jgi:hypothetical protein
LLDRDGEPPAAYLGTVVNGWIIHVNWSDLQPQSFGPIAPNNAIDQAIATVRRLNAGHPGWRLGLKLRVYGGVWAPEWAKALGGAPVPVIQPVAGTAGTVGRFWTADYGRAYADLQAKLAAKYDTVPELREVVVDRCMTFFAEPFLRDRRDTRTTASLVAAGFTVQADHLCLTSQINAHEVWRQTNSDLSFNPYQDITLGRGSKGDDEAFTESVMSYCRAILGPRCVLENNSLADPPRYPQMYAAMQRLGPPIAFQTATENRAGDLSVVLNYAASLGADSVELPVAYKKFPANMFTGIAARLRVAPA